jgi:hypothetical protein
MTYLNRAVMGIQRQQEIISQLEERIERLEAALKVYADQDNWTTASSTINWNDRFTGSEYYDGYKLAQEALEGK